MDILLPMWQVEVQWGSALYSSVANFISSTPARIGDAAEVQLHY